MINYNVEVTVFHVGSWLLSPDSLDFGALVTLLRIHGRREKLYQSFGFDVSAIFPACLQVVEQTVLFHLALEQSLEVIGLKNGLGH